MDDDGPTCRKDQVILLKLISVQGRLNVFISVQSTVAWHPKDARLHIAILVRASKLLRDKNRFNIAKWIRKVNSNRKTMIRFIKEAQFAVDGTVR